MPATESTYELQVSLVGAQPAIWRRLRLPGATTLTELHDVLQVAFRWSDRHLHSFRCGERLFTPAGFDLDGDDERRARLDTVAPRIGATLVYTYDLGHAWEHHVAVEKIDPAEGLTHAVCLTGERGVPPEDPDRLDDYDPTAFDLATVNDTLSRIRVARPPH